MRIFILVSLLSIKVWGFNTIAIPTVNPKVNNIAFGKIIPKKDFFGAQLVDDKVYLDVTDSMLNKDMLFVRHGDGYKHQYMQIRWTRRLHDIVLESPRVQSQLGVILPINNNPSILRNIINIFPIIEENNVMGTHRIDITKLFLGGAVDWDSSSKETIDSKLSYIEKIIHFENELIIKTTTVIIKGQTKLTKAMDYSLFLLPKTMKPRLFDYRMGFGSEDSSSPINSKLESPRASISRWRLEKKNKGEDISVPIHPIIFFMSSEIPKKWRPYVKAGILEWLRAFEAAGFKNAIQVKEILDDSESRIINSVNHSIVRWGKKRNVRGYENNPGSTISQIVDFRSGEILKSDILIGSSYQHLMDDYFIRCAPIDKRAQQYPFPDDLMGELIQSLVAHETGHALGLMDDNYGEYAYPFEKMRDVHWLKKMGHTPSIMSYTRHNYIPQPEDSIPPSLLIQKVGPMDVYSIKWAYTVFPNIHRTEEEKPYLEKIVGLQDSIPWYRYNKGRDEIIGPGATNEVVDNNDPIKSTELGLKNMKRVIELLPMVNRNKKDYALMERLYGKILELWYHEMSQVISLIGGYSIQYKSGGQEGNIYTPIPIEIQKKAMNFIGFHAFNPPDWLVKPACLSKIHYSTYPDKVLEVQLKLLYSLLDPQRMKRFENMEVSHGFKEISLEMLSKLQSSLFQELKKNDVYIDRNRMELQSTYVNILDLVVNQKTKPLTADENLLTYSSQSQAVFMEQLLTLKDCINENLNKEMDAMTRGHLKRVIRNL
ncbi:zinc-dependent metalloprotease [Yeosuana marina]|uniref:zinc-dependent metalloprotease n=1 Tax=Yeosuana marina TaxID=1565536 RepID=UPI0030EB207E|tara:strand:- start:9770 stop:12073 length:2304 start_codon:yes stop_codon:yes gene_type:complete